MSFMPDNSKRPHQTIDHSVVCGQGMYYMKSFGGGTGHGSYGLTAVLHQTLIRLTNRPLSETRIHAESQA